MILPPHSDTSIYLNESYQAIKPLVGKLGTPSATTYLHSVLLYSSLTEKCWAYHCRDIHCRPGIFESSLDLVGMDCRLDAKQTGSESHVL